MNKVYIVTAGAFQNLLGIFQKKKDAQVFVNHYNKGKPKVRDDVWFSRAKVSKGITVQ